MMKKTVQLMMILSFMIVAFILVTKCLSVKDDVEDDGTQEVVNSLKNSISETKKVIVYITDIVEKESHIEEATEVNEIIREFSTIEKAGEYNSDWSSGTLFSLRLLDKNGQTIAIFSYNSHCLFLNWYANEEYQLFTLSVQSPFLDSLLQECIEREKDFLNENAYTGTE